MEVDESGDTELGSVITALLCHQKGKSQLK